MNAARQDGLGPLWRTGIAYALHDRVGCLGIPPRIDWGRWIGGRQHPTVLRTAIPGSTPGWEWVTVAPPAVFPLEPIRGWQDMRGGIEGIAPGDVREARTLGVRRLRVSDATIQPGHSLIVTRDHALVPEFLDRLTWDSGLQDPSDAASLGPWRHRDDPYRLSEEQRQRSRSWTTTTWRASDARETIPRGISLFEMVDGHFGHCALDMLTRLRAVEDIDESWPILASDRMPRNIRAWIARLLPRHEIQCHAPGSVLRVRDLVVPLETARLWHAVPRFPDSPGLPATVDPQGMLWLQQRTSPSARRRHRRLWLRRDRSPNNSLEGESDLVAHARTLGFTPVSLERMPLDEVIDLLAETSDVMAPMASAVANLAAAAPGVRVLQLTGRLTILDRLGSLTWLPRLSHASGLLVGRQSRQGRYHVTPQSVVDAWTRFEGETTNDPIRRASASPG